METVTWILETDVFAHSQFDDMVSHITKRKDSGLNFDLKTVRIVPFVHEVDGPVPEVDGPIVCYGSTGIHTLSKREGWKPGVWNSGLGERAVSSHLGNLYLNSDVRFMPLSKVASEFDPSEKVFIKPESDGKEFAGMVTEVSSIEPWFRNMVEIGYLDGGEIEVAVSPAKEIGNEWRTVVVDGKVVACSVYRMWLSVMVAKEAPEDVVKAAEEAASLYSPAPVFVCDVCEGVDGMKVLEYNCFNSAGLYACDIGSVVDSVTNATRRSYCEIED